MTDEVAEIDDGLPLSMSGNRHNKSDAKMIQTVHDHAKTLGATCPIPPAAGATQSWSAGDTEAVRVSFSEADPTRHFAVLPLPRWFTDATAEPAPPDWIPFLPTPHTFRHPQYGEVALTPERNANFVAQFNAGVYQKPIQLDGEHQSKLSGAMGWIYELRTTEDGAVDAKVEWTARGTKLYKEGAYKYISPEWYDEWDDPATGETYTDVAIGAAMTTRPFFKPPHLRPLAASEHAAEIDQPIAGERSHGMTATTDTVSPVQFTELESRFTEMQGKYTDLEKTFGEVTAERDQLREANEKREVRITALETDARTKRFSDEVKGWVGTPEKNLARLLKTAERFGEDGDEFKDEVAQARAFAEQVRMTDKAGGSIFREVGSGVSDAGGTVTTRVEGMVKERMASDPKLTSDKARVLIFKEQPELVEQIEAEHRAAQSR